MKRHIDVQNLGRGHLPFVPDFESRDLHQKHGYVADLLMESFMDGHLIYRNEADMRAMASALPQDEVGRAQVFEGDVNTITYLLFSKAR